MLLLVELRKQAESDGRLHIVVSTVAAMLAGLVLLAKLDTQTGYYSLRSVLASWPWVLTLGAAAALLLSFFYNWARALYSYYCAWTLVESGLLYLTLEHETPEILPALTRAERFSRVGLSAAGGQLSFRLRIGSLLRSYMACCHALLYQPWPGLLRWLDLSLVLVSLAAGVWIGCMLYFRVYAWLSNPYGQPPGAEVFIPLRICAIIVLILMLARGTLRRARTDGLRLGLADALGGE